MKYDGPDARGMDEVRRIGARVTNWGRWGVNDELGTLNLITRPIIARACQLATTGRSFDLSIPIGPDLPTWPPRHKRPPVSHVMTVLPDPTERGMVAADDRISMPLQISTQWDGLSHVGYDGRLYNGVPTSAVTASGAGKNSIDAIGGALVGQAVLLDLPAWRGVDWLPAPTVITPDDLEAAERRQGVRVSKGDILLVRTGWRRKAIAQGWAGWLDEEPGLGLECAEWLHNRQVSALATDNHAVEVTPTDRAGIAYPLHCVLIRDMGMPLGEMFDFEALAAACAADEDWTFLFVAPPLRVVGAVGAPATPIAIK